MVQKPDIRRPTVRVFLTDYILQAFENNSVYILVHVLALEEEACDASDLLPEKIQSMLSWNSNGRILIFKTGIPLNILG